jgi:DNA polymerase-3 subunit delta
LDFQTIKQELSHKQYKPVYFLHGTESYFIDTIANEIEANALSEAEKSFNQTIFYGKEIDAKTLIDTCYRYPMMSPRQVVIVKEVQEMKTLNDLAAYVEKPVHTTILVLCYKHKKFSLTSALGKALKKTALVFESKSLYENQIPDWIQQYLKPKKLNLQTDAANLIAEYLGTELSKITNEMEKLVINLPAGTTVTPQHVEEYIGISKDYNIFELQKALGTRDIFKSSRIILYFNANPRKNPLVMVISSLYNYFSKLLMLYAVSKLSDEEVVKTLDLRSSFFLKEYRNAAKHYSAAKVVVIIGILKEYDLKSKGIDFNSTNTDEGELLREMVWKILHT